MWQIIFCMHSAHWRIKGSPSGFGIGGCRLAIIKSIYLIELRNESRFMPSGLKNITHFPINFLPCIRFWFFLVFCHLFNVRNAMQPLTCAYLCNNRAGETCITSPYLSIPWICHWISNSHRQLQFIMLVHQLPVFTFYFCENRTLET